VREIAVIGAPIEPATSQFLEAVYRQYLPNKIVVAAAPDDVTLMTKLPLLHGKSLVAGKPAAYVCEDYTCKAPVTSSSDLEEVLAHKD
jgi:uncharacterized protein